MSWNLDSRLGAACDKAEKLGHVMEHDPPANVLSKMDRYTCTRCGKAAVGNGSIAYGSATEELCTH